MNQTQKKEKKEKYKYFITADKVVIEAKYKDAIQSKNYSRLVWFSHIKISFPLELNTRRPRISESLNKYIELPEVKKFI